MAYVKKIWKDYPDTTTQIKAEYLNNIENGIEAVDTAINEVNNKFNYSTNEQVIGKWIDGKPLYRKVFEYTLGSTINSWKTIGTIPNIDFPVRMYGTFYNGEAKFTIPHSYYNEGVTLYCDTSNKLFREQHNYTYANNLPSYVIIEYTKTTD